MKKTLIILLLIMIPLPLVFTEGFIGGGAKMNLSSKTLPSFQAELYIDGGFDLMYPLSNAWSFFTDGGGEFFYVPHSSNFGGSGYVNGDFSYRGTTVFTKLELGTYFEHSLARTAPVISNHIGVYFSLDFDQISIYTEPVFVWEIEDYSHSLGGEGRLGTSVGIRSLLLTPEISGSIFAVPEGIEIQWGTSLDLSWYPGLPLTVTGSVGLRRTDSPVTDTIVSGEPPQPVENKTSFFWTPEIALFLGPRFDLGIGLSGSVVLKDHGYITESGTLGSTREYRFQEQPTVTLTFFPTSRLSLRLGLGLTIIRSNSAYLDSVTGSGELSASFFF